MADGHITFKQHEVFSKLFYCGWQQKEKDILKMTTFHLSRPDYVSFLSSKTQKGFYEWIHLAVRHTWGKSYFLDSRPVWPVIYIQSVFTRMKYYAYFAPVYFHSPSFWLLQGMSEKLLLLQKSSYFVQDTMNNPWNMWHIDKIMQNK